MVVLQDLGDGNRVRERHNEQKLRNVLPVIDEDRFEEIAHVDVDSWPVEELGLLVIC